MTYFYQIKPGYEDVMILWLKENNISYRIFATEQFFIALDVVTEPIKKKIEKLDYAELKNELWIQ